MILKHFIYNSLYQWGVWIPECPGKDDNWIIFIVTINMLSLQE